MRPVLCHLALAASLAFAGLQAAHAGERTYRWVDEKGRVHYSDVKSEKGQQVEVKPGSGVSETPKDSPATLAARQLDCQRKKDQVSVYNSSSKISETDNLGNTRTYSDEERQKLIDRAQQQAQTACSQPGADVPLPTNEQR
ncbi:MAG: DUF4124 domain-containing protein [Stagnimonas sp.]|nr:DUF4124 domain-containing protein [Stagnimonas sp.]